MSEDPTAQDQYELEWWRRMFACRFQADNLPKPGTPLLGHRLTLMVRKPDGTDIPWGPVRHTSWGRTRPADAGPDE